MRDTCDQSLQRRYCKLKKEKRAYPQTTGEEFELSTFYQL